MREVTSAFSEHVEQGIIWKVQLDTYSRELERYGSRTIEQSEELFHVNSNLVVKHLSQFEDVDDESETEIRWFFGLKGIDNLLNHFKFTLLEKKTFIGNLADGFGREFNMDSALRKQIGDRSRKEKPIMESIMTEGGPDSQRFELYFNTFKEFSDNHQQLAEGLLAMDAKKELEVDLNSLLESYIHMFMNRLFNNEQRRQEMWQYHMLWHFYRSQLARGK
jgi:thiopeptide-type bacteriocin biosynthesis protein